MSEYHICANCKYFANYFADCGSGYRVEYCCKLDVSQSVSLFTPCKIGKWEAKDE